MNFRPVFLRPSHLPCGFYFALACATSAQLFQRRLWFLYAVCHAHACATSAQLFQRLLWFLYVVCHVHACATSAQFLQRLLWFLYAVYHFFAGLKFGRMFQLPLCSVYVVCLALFSQISLVQSLRFIASFLAIHCALLFDGKVCPHTQTARLACTVVSHCGHTFFGRLSLSIGQPPLHTTHGMYEYGLPAQKSIFTRNDQKFARVLSSQKNETPAAQQCYLRQETRDHCAQTASVTHACVYFSLPRGKRIIISILAC